MKKKPGHRAPDAIRVKAIRLMRSGSSDGQIAEATGYSKSWVRQFRLRVDSGKEHELVADALTTTPDVDPPPREKPRVGAGAGLHPSPQPEEKKPVDISAKAILEDMVAHAISLKESVARAQADGNEAAAQKYGRDLVVQQNAILRQRKLVSEEVSGLVLTDADLRAADDELEALVTKVSQWGLTCARCGRALRMAACGQKEGDEDR